MLNQDSVRAVDASHSTIHDQFMMPLYDSYCFSRIPATVQSLLIGTDRSAGLPDSVLQSLPQQYDKVILFFVDAFGWRFFSKWAYHYPFLQRFLDQGVVSKLTSMFPSTTAAHTTTIHTGQPVGKSGVFEWFFYEPTLDRIIAPLLYSFAGDRGRETMAVDGVKPETIFPTETIYKRLTSKGVRSYVFQHRDYTPSTFTNIVTKGARVSAFKTISEGLVNLTEAVLAEKGKAYFYLYFDAIDGQAHLYGPDSPQVNAELDTFFTAMEKLLHQTLNGQIDKTLLILTADHGQEEISPETTIFLNKQADSIERFIRPNAKGSLLVPAGSPRDPFFYIKPEMIDEAQDLLSRQLAGHASVVKIKEMIDQGYFGAPSQLSDKFLSRISDLVILPYAQGSVWWYERGKFEQHFYGSHGGLVRNEMEITFAALPYMR